MQDFYVCQSGANVRVFYKTGDWCFGVVGEMLQSVQGFLRHSHFENINLVNGVPDIAEFFPELEARIRIKDLFPALREQRPYHPSNFLREYVENAAPLIESDYLACREIIEPMEDSAVEKTPTNDGIEGIVTVVTLAGRRAKDWATAIPILKRT